MNDPVGEPTKLPHAECAARVNAAAQTYPALSRWRNLKTGDTYIVFGVGLDAGSLEPAVAYMDARCLLFDPPGEYKKAFWWFRSVTEFAVKFQKVSDPPLVVYQRSDSGLVAVPVGDPATGGVGGTADAVAGVAVEESSP